MIQETLDRLRRDCSLYERVVKVAEDGRGKDGKEGGLEELTKANEDLIRAVGDKQDALNALESTPRDLADAHDQNTTLSTKNYDMRKRITDLQATLDYQQAQRSCLENEMNELKIQVSQFVETAGARFEKPKQLQEIQDKLENLESCFSKK